MVLSNKMPFLTVNKAFQAELEEKKSRFLATLCPLNEFEQTLALSRQNHPKASHHVTAFRRMAPDNQIHEGAKDDGEPSGTSGMPVLKTMIGANLMDCAIIVVRYFGGTKLGTGGLARAYSGAAKRTIEEAELTEWYRLIKEKIHTPFDRISDIEQKLIKADLSVFERTFDEKGALLSFEGAEENVAKFMAAQSPLKAG